MVSLLEEFELPSNALRSWLGERLVRLAIEICTDVVGTSSPCLERVLFINANNEL